MMLELRRDWIWHDQPELGESAARLLARKNARVNGRVYVVPHERNMK